MPTCKLLVSDGVKPAEGVCALGNIEVVLKGFGLGFERLVAYVTGVQNVRDVIPFQRTPRSGTF